MLQCRVLMLIVLGPASDCASGAGVCWAAPESGRESDADWDQDSYYTGPACHPGHVCTSAAN